jgi:hypothetical protein
MTILTGGLLFLCAPAVLLTACNASIDISMTRNDLRANFLPFQKPVSLVDAGRRHVACASNSQVPPAPSMSPAGCGAALTGDAHG